MGRVAWIIQMSPKCNNASIIIRGRQKEISHTQNKNAMPLQNAKQARCYTPGFEDGGRGHTRNARDAALEAGKPRKQIFP